MWNLEVSRVVFCVRKLSCTLIACYSEYTSIVVGECIDYNICLKRASFLLSYILLEISEGRVCVREKAVLFIFYQYTDPKCWNIRSLYSGTHVITWKIYTVSTNQNIWSHGKYTLCQPIRTFVHARRFHRVSKWPRLHCLYIYFGFCKTGTLHENKLQQSVCTKDSMTTFFAFDFNFSLSFHLRLTSTSAVTDVCVESAANLCRAW